MYGLALSIQIYFVYQHKNEERMMIVENTKESRLFDYENVKLVISTLQKIKKYASKNFAKFSAITAVGFSIVLWIIRSLGYFYTLGRFSVYHIDKSYIDVWSEGFLAQVIRDMSIVIMFLIVNYIYFQLSISKNTKRRIVKVLFVLLELCGLSIFIFPLYGISFIDILKHLPNTSMHDIKEFVILWIVWALAVNWLGIFTNFYYRLSKKKLPIKKKVVSENETVVKSQLDKREEKKTEDENNKEKRDLRQDDLKYKKVIEGMGILLIMCIGAFGCMYTMGSQIERQRSAFRFVKEKTEIIDGEKYMFTDQATGDSYYLYPIIYENQDVYIVSQISKDEEMTIDYDFLKVIDKENVSTYYIDNLNIKRDF